MLSGQSALGRPIDFHVRPAEGWMRSHGFFRIATDLAKLDRTGLVEQIAPLGSSQSPSQSSTPPTVLGVYASGSAWSSSFLTYLQASGLGTLQLGYRLLGGANQLAPLPWTGITRISVVFSQDVSLDASATGLALIGSPDLPLPPLLARAVFTYDSGTHTAQWTFASPLPANKYLLCIPSQAVTNAQGLALDGEWTNAIGQSPGGQFPSGNQVQGGNFNFRFNVLPGDADQSGAVNDADANKVRDLLLSDTSSLQYSAFADLDGDGVASGADGSLVRLFRLTSLPATDGFFPTASIPSLSPVPLSSAVAQMQLTFSEAVSGVRLSALSLSKNGGSNLLTAAQTLTTSDGINYTLGNLAGLTANSGNYTLTLTAAGSGIVDSAGNALVGNASGSFVTGGFPWSGGPAAFLPGVSSYTPNLISTVAGEVVSTSSGNVLVIVGTTSTDTMILSESANSMTVTTSTGTQVFSGPFVGVAIYGFGGGDTIRLDHSIDSGITSVVYGGSGGNTVSDAGPDKAYLYAGSGNDTLISIGGGADYLYGGAGVDSFWFDSTDTLTGSTTAENAAKSVHRITAFVQPTTDPAQAVSLEIAGQDIVDPVAMYGYTNNFVNQPLWNGTAQFNDPRQGILDDCYFLAGLSALAETDPGLLQQSIVALGDGTYAVRFFRNGAESYYRIDGQLPTNGGSPAYDQLGHGGALWVALEEKAFAQFRNGQNSYSSLNYGRMDEGYSAITGWSFSTTFTSSLTADALALSMANSLTAGHAETAGSGNPTSAPIVANHAYSVHAVTLENGTWYVTVRNPWGYDGAAWDSNPNDGLLKLTASQFQACFPLIETCSA